MPTVKKSIEVDVPVNVAYNQWTQFESFPQFMDGVESVQQLDDKRLHWRAKVGGKVNEWDAEIVQQQPDNVISWRSTSGPRNEGTVRFAQLGSNRSRIDLEMHWEPQDVIERVGDVLGAEDARIQGDLKRFKEFIESRGTETGAWRGRIDGERVGEAAGWGSRGSRPQRPCAWGCSRRSRGACRPATTGLGSSSCLSSPRGSSSVVST
jgi:uncharacterized membrane protein